jgi:hypothetical protein
MITRPTTAQLLGAVRTEIAERIAPAIADPQLATSLHMIDHILSTLMVRADHELGWMVEEMNAVQAVATRVAESALPGAAHVADALTEFVSARSGSANAADVTDDYNRASEVLSRAVEATSAETGELRESVLALLAGRLAHEERVIGDFQLVGRG